MQEASGPATLVRFGVFEADFRTGELRKSGRKINLKEQPFQVLATLLERPGEMVSREELQKKLWPAETFVDFDTGLNKAIMKIREALDDSADAPRFVETLPRRGYRFIAPVERAGAGTAMAGGASPEEPQAGRALPERRRRGRWAVALMGAVLVAALLGLMARNWRLRGQARPRIESIAVLPLENLSGDPAQEYFSDGMTDELISAIARIGSLRAISRTSSMHYKGARKSLPAIANELGVDAVLEGTVLRSGERVRITAQLIQARDDQHIWAGKYERNLSDVLQLQGEVAEAIADQIQSKLTNQEHASFARARPVNPAAYEAYLEGIYFLSKGTERLDKSIELFSKAIELDPAYARAYAGLSESYVYLGIYGLRPAGEVYPKARAAAMKALDLDETVGEAHQTLADVKKFYEWDWIAAEQEYKRALALNPSNSIAHAQYADYLSRMGRHGEARAAAARARELDPLSAVRWGFLGLILYRARTYDEALRACEKAIELDPNVPNPYWFLALAHEQKREFPQVIIQLKKAVGLSKAPIYQALLAHAYALAGERPKALSILAQLKTPAKQRYVSPLDVALIYTGLDDRDSAFEWLEKAYQERTMRIGELPDPVFDTLRSDPRFWDLMRRMGLHP